MGKHRRRSVLAPYHRFEWTRQEFRDWEGGIGRRLSYAVRFLSVRPVDEKLAATTQMGVFTHV